IENRPGGALNIGTEAVVKAPPDGYTLLLATTTNTINATLYDKLNFNFIRDIAPVATISRYTWVMVVHPSFPAKTVPEFIAYAKANPGKINIASGGIGKFLGSKRCRPMPAETPDRLLELTQEHIRPVIGLIDRLNEAGAEDELRVISKQLTRLSLGVDKYPPDPLGPPRQQYGADSLSLSGP